MMDSPLMMDPHFRRSSQLMAAPHHRRGGGMSESMLSPFGGSGLMMMDPFRHMQSMMSNFVSSVSSFCFSCYYDFTTHFHIFSLSSFIA